MGDKPKIVSLKKHAGIAGQYAITAVVQYPGEEPQAPVDFIGSVYGGPVIMAWDSAAAVKGRVEVFVTDPGQHGPFGLEWVRRFFAERG